jgi:hypothetical protein
MISDIDYGLPITLFQVEFRVLVSTHHVNKGGVQRRPHKSLFTSHTLMKSLSGGESLRTYADVFLVNFLAEKIKT